MERQPDQVRQFLLQTSILTRLDGSLCDAVTGQGGGKAMLEVLDRGNLFLVPLDDRRRWYRYHHLFADVLQARLPCGPSSGIGQWLHDDATCVEQPGQSRLSAATSPYLADHTRRHDHHLVLLTRRLDDRDSSSWVWVASSTFWSVRL